MAMDGIPLSEIARFLGDSEKTVEKIYAKHAPDYLRMHRRHSRGSQTSEGKRLDRGKRRRLLRGTSRQLASVCLWITCKWGKSPGTQVQHALVTRTRGTEFRHFLASDSGTVWKSARSARTFAPLTIRGKKRNALTDQDFADMRKVVGYIHRHSAQRPRGDITDTRWQKPLMNWGHDPA
jgi:hypothetical protein